MSRVMSRGGIEGWIGGTDRLAIRHLWSVSQGTHCAVTHFHLFLFFLLWLWFSLKPLHIHPNVLVESTVCVCTCNERFALTTLVVVLVVNCTTGNKKDIQLLESLCRVFQVRKWEDFLLITKSMSRALAFSSEISRCQLVLWEIVTSWFFLDTAFNWQSICHTNIWRKHS